jgi:hypothetical protein
MSERINRHLKNVKKCKREEGKKRRSEEVKK